MSPLPRCTHHSSPFPRSGARAMAAAGGAAQPKQGVKRGTAGWGWGTGDQGKECVCGGGWVRVPALMAAASRTLTGRPPAMHCRTRPLRVRSESSPGSRGPLEARGWGSGAPHLLRVAAAGVGRGGSCLVGKTPEGARATGGPGKRTCLQRPILVAPAPRGALRKCPGGVLEPRFARLPPSRWDLHYHLIKKQSKKNKKRCCCPSEGEGALELVMCGNQPQHPGRYVCAFLPGAALPT